MLNSSFYLLTEPPPTTSLAVEFNAVLVRSATCARTEPLSGVRSPSENKKTPLRYP